ncbi:dolichyl pyrophosphate Man9GlcNAc2 alpha-1,3-glucosyltransferase [Phlebotomus argentipes]|uniref:dolichyl pyrophosphate Man9GlcNAc2 alpha-1,3-glucosyltransferase n=1 Tax=Phlebotomus argentipes TaxID=94469 RepID=UPI002893149B|nr:dolichyl pyrophosphate Man9GlcNAc2 alpha-1,3-glucosyltransferase [Phlebotomus argentipes]
MNQKWAVVMCIVGFGAFLRATVSLHSYSGAGKPPMYGDFEAQRHWQEITTNLPVKEWYRNSTDNDLLYWGLDYPPLTAYHSWACGKVAQLIDPAFVQLRTSRGITSDAHKLFMRLSVFLADLLIYLPAVFWGCSAVWKQIRIEKAPASWKILHLLLAMSFPGQILIDNGHFQYNNISLGLTIWAIASLLHDHLFLASLLFTLALNYKQMSLYHALPFFFLLLAKCLPGQRNKIGCGGALKRLLGIGGVVMMTFAILWLPWLGDFEDLQQVVKRIFPFNRGLFEDKVANFWCTFNAIFKFKDAIPKEKMALYCLSTTMASVLPSCIHPFFSPTKRNFLLSLINSSLGFFLFSFQVHEKSILLVTVPVILTFPLDPIVCFWFLNIATFSMMPLLQKDGLYTAFLGLQGIFLLSIRLYHLLGSKSDKSTLDFFHLRQFNQHKKTSWRDTLTIWGFYLSLAGQIALLIGQEFIKAPENLPYLFPYLISAYSGVHFMAFFLYFNLIQLFHK